MNSWKPDFLSLRLFVAVCEEASIARAAERESIVPSAVSKRVAEIEASLGLALLLRGHRGVKPTPAGTAFLHHARQILLSTEKLISEMGDYERGARGHVRVLANISSIVQFLAQDVASFLVDHPQVQVDLGERVSTDVIDGVREGAADVGICLANVADVGLERRAYEKDRLIVLVHPEHPLAARGQIEFSEAMGYDFVSLQANARTTTFLMGLASRTGRALNYRMHVSTFDALSHVVAANLAIAVVAEGAVRHLQTALGLCTVELTDPWASREILVYLRKYDALPMPSRLLVEHLLDRSHHRRVDRT